MSGALVEETYPSGRKVKNSFQADGALGKVETQPSGGSYATRADNFTYTAAGMISSMQLGNSKWENANFNSRLQPTQLGLGTSSSDQSLWKVNYDYGTTDNNGNVKSQTITVPTLTAIVQNYTYDSLNRIKSAEETVSSSTIWKQTFDYDRFGNRRFNTTGSNTTTIPGGCSTAQCNPTIDTANNRFTTGQGYTYDLSGNLLTDAEGRTFTYDAENKQQTVANSGGTIGTYYYDGDGKRVKKVASTETTLFVYDASAKLVAEYLLTEDTPSAPTTSYLTSDTLGSPRVITDASGNIESRRDFMPFGEEISAIGGRTSGLGYQSDDTRQKFTSYERDNETNLDYAKARMFGSSLGRFTSPDPIKMSDSRLYDPQTINLYVYARNNPLIIIDPNGKDIIKLGRTTDAINSDITATQKALEGDLSDEERKRLQTKLGNFQTELQANQVVGGWLAAAQSVGELKNAKLSDFSIVTDGRVDLVNLDMDYVKKNFPKATKKQIEEVRKKSFARAEYLINNARAIAQLGKIYILTESSFFQMAALPSIDSTNYGVISQSDFNIVGAGVLGHEKWHVKFGGKERPAYAESLRILRKFTPEAIGNKAYIQDEINQNAKRAGVKP